MPAQPKTFDDYLAALDHSQRLALEKLRQTIRKAAPKAEECLSYGIPSFRQGRMLVGLGAAKKHCALYLMSGGLLKDFPEVTAKYDTSKGTIRFAVDKPLPATLVRKLVKARLAENAARDAKKGK